jgi:hypothetical protein
MRKTSIMQRIRIFEKLLTDLEKDARLMKQNFSKALEMLNALFKEIKEFAEKYFLSGNSFRTVRRIVTNVTFRNSQATEIAEFNSRINACALDFNVISQFDVERNRQEDVDAFRIQYEASVEETLASLSAIQNNSNDMKHMILELKEMGDDSRSFFYQQFNSLEAKATAQKTITKADLEELRLSSERDKIEIMSAVQDSLNSLMKEAGDIKKATDIILDETQQLKALVEKILNEDLLTQNDLATRDALLKKLKAISKPSIRGKMLGLVKFI